MRKFAGMKRIFVFNTYLMNGTVTMQTDVIAATTRELAQKIRATCIEESKKGQSFFHVLHSDVKEIPVYETEDEVP